MTAVYYWQVVELRRECEQLQEDLERERDQCRHLVDTERHGAAAARDKLAGQLAQLKATNEQVLTLASFVCYH